MTMQDELRDRATWQAALAELVATAFLTLAALLSGGPFAVAIVLLVFVFAIGSISGGLLNPAVAVGLVVARHISVAKGVLFIVAEIVGAFIALAVAPLIHPLAASYAAASMGGEFFGFGILMLAVLANVGGYLPKAASGLTVGGALLAGLLTTGGILNPAVALAMGVAAVSPWSIWAPIVGALVFAAIFRALAPFHAGPQLSGIEAPPTELQSRKAA
jgi:aquaporin Z